MADQTTPEKSELAQKEEEVLRFWNEHKIFEKSIEKDAPLGEYVFYDGPPFATGLPHYGHILAGTIKDVIPRYRTMRGFRVRRRWGWDCHGLPLENEIEKELGLKNKKDIESLGVDAFNAAARNAVLRYADEWRKQVPRLGRWVDMDHDYKTMDTTYTESVWWGFNELYNRGLIYEGYKSMHLCPRCGTTLSNFEVNQGYKDIVDFAVTIALPFVHDKDTALLVWTTTPWTLPGNMAAAVNRDVEYVKVRVPEKRTHFVLAKERLQTVMGDVPYEVLETFKGERLIGISYEPPFPYFKNRDIANKENAWKIYHAPYVSLQEGTGAVHLAPAFGAEDLELAGRENIPIVHHVNRDGVFTDDVTDFRGKPAKPRGDHQVSDIEIIKYLAHHDLLFKKEKITHSYPLCWRCDTPLLNYASSSWFVRVTSIKERLVKANEKILWVPKEIGDRRFGNWLEGARDWAISRSRYWGAPLPVWKNVATGNITSIGSIEELKAKIKRSGNRYFIMRHGEAQLTGKQQLDSRSNVSNVLTEAGKAAVLAEAKNLSREGISYIIASPLPRTMQTAQLLARELQISEEHVIADPRLLEVAFGAFEGKSVPEYHAFFSSYAERMYRAPEKGENWNDVKRRVSELLYELERTYKHQGILLISHNGPLQMLQAGALGLSEEESATALADPRLDMHTAEVRELPFVPLPHDRNFVLDLHRPFIDDVVLVDLSGEEMRRIPDVFDCWFESGSMPYGEQHYPFEHTDIFEPVGGLFKKARGYPADFIAEGLDQTRGWFYSLLVLNLALFDQAPYRSVIVNGLVLAEDGQKMSKRLKNYPDPMHIVNKYGADALRYFLLMSPVVRGEDIRFSEEGVAEVARKVVGRLRNVHAFLEMYGSASTRERRPSSHVLDRWIRARLAEVTAETTAAMEAYELDSATRPIASFIDDLSTWYLRRSRERLKSEREDERSAAYETLRHVLFELSKLVAPFMPFYAEELYQRVRNADDAMSVHLAQWPEVQNVTSEEHTRLTSMEGVRSIVTLALEARQKAGIRVRQPLRELRVKPQARLTDEELELIRDEVNVKRVVVDDALPSEIFLDTVISESLKEEGVIRELTRSIQDLRKEMGLLPSDSATLEIASNAAGKALLERHMEELARITRLRTLNIVEALSGKEVAIQEYTFSLKLLQ